MTYNVILYNILLISCNKSQFPVFVEKRDWGRKDLLTWRHVVLDCTERLFVFNETAVLHNKLRTRHKHNSR